MAVTLLNRYIYTYIDTKVVKSIDSDNFSIPKKPRSTVKCSIQDRDINIITKCVGMC